MDTFGRPYNGYYDWSRADVERAIRNAKAEGRASVSLAMEHNSYDNELDVVRWAKEMGCEVQHESERVIVTIK